ncbi:MAG: enoyl-CoA hydratase/isomerase family protein, partial [Candidatus Thermoplasmatota archaeon]|nr:enoyl-CoA hydratase/isomerase family protein [Candidatus Thermoplasmatota archaeon]
MSFVSYEDLIVEKTDAILLLKLNRPNVLNALNFRLVGHIAETMRAADKDDGVKVIVLSGNGKAFSAGADVADMSGKSF